jgi:hypothetical protein
MIMMMIMMTMVMVIVIMRPKCEIGMVWEGLMGGGRKGHLGVKRIKVCYIYTQR